MAYFAPAAPKGLGAYPDETCYDPSRPSWLPYWLDDFQEEACKANTLLCGNTTCGSASAAQEQANAGSVITGVGTPPPANPAGNNSWVPWALGGAAALLFVMGGHR